MKKSVVKTAVRLLAVGMLLSLTACSSGLKYFTTTVTENYQLNSESVRLIQFYVDAPFTLYHVESSVVREPDKVARTTFNKYEQNVVVDTRTPGRALSLSGNITIDFGENLVCEFMPLYSTERRKTYYYLVRINSNDIIELSKFKNSVNPVPTRNVIYNNREYKVIFERSGDNVNWPALLFDEDVLQNYKKETHRIKGVKL